MKQQAQHTQANVLADLSHEGLISVTGEEARTFLQGQLSTDLELLTPGMSQLSSWNNAKGRVVTLFRVFERDGAIYLALPRTLLAPVLKRLSLYVLRAKAKLADASDALASCGLAGSEAAMLLQKAGISLPAGVNQVSTHDGVQVTRLHGTLPRYLLCAPSPALAAVWKQLETADARLVSYDQWTLLKILAGEPTVYPETSEHFVAQMLALDELGAIDFKKGCYIGQEVIARAHYRGAVKRHLAQAESESSAVFKPGMELQVQGQDSNVAEVVDAQRDAKGVWRILLVVQDDHHKAQLIHKASNASVQITSA